MVDCTIAVSSLLQERLTLKHRNSSKWARRALKRGQAAMDPTTRDAINEQLALGQQLRRRIEGKRGDNSEDDEGGSDDRWGSVALLGGLYTDLLQCLVLAGSVCGLAQAVCFCGTAPTRSCGPSAAWLLARRLTRTVSNVAALGRPGMLPRTVWTVHRASHAMRGWLTVSY